MTHSTRDATTPATSTTDAPRARAIEDVQGLTLRLWDHGAPSPSNVNDVPRVLFVHGYLDTGRSFDAVARALRDGDASGDASGAHCLALDLRGHGASDRIGAGGSYHLLDHMKDVAIVIDKLAKQGEPIDVLVGHSLGGNVTILVAGAAPQLVKNLVLVDTCGAPPGDPEEQPQRLGELIESVLLEKRAFSTVRTIDEAAAKVRSQNVGISEAAARRMVEHVMVPTEDGALRFPFDPRLRGPSPIRWPEAMWRALCQRLSMPVTVIRATDGYVPEGETLDGRVACMTDGRVLTIAGPHHLHVEKPRDLAAAIRTALARVSAHP